MAAHKIELASKVVGRVAWVGVEMGDKIEKDQVLVRLEDDEYKARVMQEEGQLDNARAKLAELEAGSRPEEIAQALASLEAAQAELSNAQISYQRMKDLEGTRSVSRQQIDDAEALMRSRKAQVDARRQMYEMAKTGPRKETIDAQRATVRQLEGSLAMAKIDLSNTVIRSPIAATVLERNVEVGEFVTTGFVGDRGAKGYVVSIADLTDLRVELDVSQKDFANVSAKQPCRIVTDAYPDRKYEGIVDLISPEANRQKATVLVRVKVLNPDELLKPDMNATVSFLSIGKSATTQSAGGVIRVPAAAVRDGAVFVLEAGRAVRRPVTTGTKFAGGEIEIRKGLIGGEDLIVNAPTSLSDGDRVRSGSGN
jgi:HlyD family secretion protein